MASLSTCHLGLRLGWQILLNLEVPQSCLCYSFHMYMLLNGRFVKKKIPDTDTPSNPLVFVNHDGQPMTIKKQCQWHVEITRPLTTTLTSPVQIYIYTRAMSKLSTCSSNENPCVGPRMGSLEYNYLTLQ